MSTDVRIGLVQINNSFSGQNYLPYATACLQGYVQQNSPRADRYSFVLGRGWDLFERARSSLLTWRQFEIPWLEFHGRGPELVDAWFQA